MRQCPGCVGEQCANQTIGENPLLVGCATCLDAVLVESGEDGVAYRWAPGFARMEESAPRGSVIEGILRIVTDVISQLPTLPAIPQRVISMTHDPLISMNEISDVVSEDAVMTMKILGMANSAYFAAIHEINDLNTACSRLGMRSVANVAHTISQGHLYKTKNPDFRKLMGRVWQHALATAHAAEALGELIPDMKSRQLFVAGLTHDVGKLVLLDAITNHYQGNVGRLKSSPRLMCAVFDRFGPAVGLHVVQYWKLAPEFAYTSLYNQRPTEVPVDSMSKIVHVVALASDMADAAGFSIEEEECSPMEDHPSLAPLGINHEVFQREQARLAETLEAVLGVLSGV